jgi:hypothetical protein
MPARRCRGHSQGRRHRKACFTPLRFSDRFDATG